MRLRGLLGLFLALAVALFVLPSAATYYTDWLWFQNVGLERVFLRTLNAQALVFLGTFAAVYLFLYSNLRFARRRTAERPRVVLGTGADGRPIAVRGGQIAGLAVPIALVVALILGIAGASRWMTWLMFFHQVSFGTADPLLGRDVSFYVFGLPLYELVRQQALVVVFASLAGCTLYYVFSGSFVLQGRPGVSWPRIRLVPAARRHLSLLIAGILILLAWGTWLEVPTTLLTAPPAASSLTFGASYSDVYARIPFLWATVAMLVVGAGLSIWHGFGSRGWPLPLAVALYFILSAAGSLYGSFVQRLVVTPNEQNVEQPFIEHNITATRQAYSLDRVVERQLSGDAELTAADIAEHAGTIENVRLWDHEPLLRTFSQIQEIRTYYQFHSIDNDRYVIDGKYRQVMLSARELNTLSMANRSWVNERLTFTHGYGIALGPVNQVTTQGLPVLFIQDLPPVSTVDLRLEEPSIYFGELSSSYVLVNTAQPEFHYPRGDDNEYTSYSGTGGVPVGSLVRRLLFAIRFGSTDILVTNQLTPDSRIMFHRQIVDRIQRITPFLTLDADPYPVVSAGRLFWIQDAYTTTDSFPYSTPYETPGRFGEFNYVRNSVKVVVDAYNGDVTFYLADPDDPLVTTIDSIFPELLRPLDQMPPDLRRHVRYPEDIFRIQAQMFTVYHMTNPQVFYNKEDQWQTPVIDTGQNSVAMQPYYTIMTLPGESAAEFIQMLPFTPRAKDNLAAWMVARSDGAHYGRLVVFQFPKQALVFGPRQINGRINQDQVISPQITLWNQRGSEVIQGTLLVIPVRESLLYVRPLYLQSPEGRIPELKQVIVAYQGRIVMAETLTRALAEIFGRGLLSTLAPDQLAAETTSVIQTTDGDDGTGAPTAAAGPTSGAVPLLLEQAQDHFEAADEALREGDLARYQEEVGLARAAIAEALPAAETAP